jgi:uncharacterized protein YoxC
MPITRLASWLVLQAPTVVQDTASGGSLLQQITSIATAVLTIAFLVLTVALVPAAWNFRSSYKRVNALLDRIYGDINPIMRHASTIADNVNYISTSIRVDVQQISQSIAAANQRLTEAVAMTEERLREVNALLTVAQEEAEAMFLSTASTVRGIRAGASVLRDSALPPAAGLAEDLETLDDEYDEYDDLHDHEVTDGDEHSPATGAEPEKPRIRRRPRRDGPA